MTNHIHADDTGIGLTEFYVRIKSSLLPSLAIGVLCAGLAFAFTKSLQKIFASTAKFTITTGTTSSIPDVAGLMTGLTRSVGSNETALVTDKIMSRDFIISLFPKTGIDKDPYFNGDNDSPKLLSLIFGEEERTPEEKIEKIVGKYRQTVRIDVSPINNVISLRVEHAKAKIAAQLANTIVDTHIQNINNKRDEANEQKISLMEKRLFNAQVSLDNALEAARSFAVKNSVRSQEELGVNSLNLTRFRKEAERFTAALAGIDYIEDKKQNSSNGDLLDLNDFFLNNPRGFTPLRNELGWTNDQGTAPFPSPTRLASLRQSLSEQKSQIERTVRIIQSEASQNAEAAGELAALERNIEVQKRVYTTLTTQFESADLSADLQGETVERIQQATKALNPAWPEVKLTTIVAFFVGTLAVLLAAFARSLFSGRFYSPKSIEDAFQLPVRASDVGKSVGYRPQSHDQITQRSRKVRNPELLDFALTLSESKPKTICILGVPNPSIAHNLAALLGRVMTDTTDSIAIVDLAKRSRKTRNTNEAMIQTDGVLEKAEEVSGVQFLRWVAIKDPMQVSLDEALSKTEATFDLTIIVCAGIKSGIPQNRVVLSRVDRVVVLTEGKKTMKIDVDWVMKLLSKVPEEKVDLMLV